jgi:hypothetical protein
MPVPRGGYRNDAGGSGDHWEEQQMMDVGRRLRNVTDRETWAARGASFVAKAKATKAVWFPPGPVGSATKAASSAKKATKKTARTGGKATRKTTGAGKQAAKKTSGAAKKATKKTTGAAKKTGR